jgi:hypothetical protein
MNNKEIENGFKCAVSGSVLLTKRQKEILIKLYNGYETTSADKMGTVHLFKGDDSTIINSKSTNILLIKKLIYSIFVGNHSSGYALTQNGSDLVERMLLKTDR